MNKRLSRLAVTALLAASAVFTAMAEKAVAIVAPDGTVSEISLEQLDRIEIGPDAVTVRDNAGNTEQHKISEIERINIGTEFSGIREIIAAGNTAVWPTETKSTVNVAGAKPSTPVNLYSIRGLLQAQTVTDSEGTALLSLDRLAPGLYILNIGNYTVKITKK